MAQHREVRREEITELVSAFVARIPGAQDRLFSIIYGELYRLAKHQLRRERANHSLSPTDLVNEAYLRLVNQRSSNCKNRDHFFRISATVMRRVLVDYARARKAQKRGGGEHHRRNLSTLVEAGVLHSECQPIDILALDQALEELSRKSAARAQVIELRFFAGLSLQETARIMGVHEVTVKRHWKFSRAWLFSKMKEAGETP